MKFTLACLKADILQTTTFYQKNQPTSTNLDAVPHIFFMLFDKNGEPLTAAGVPTMPSVVSYAMHFDEEEGAFVPDSDLIPLRMLGFDDIETLAEDLARYLPKEILLTQKILKFYLAKLAVNFNKRFQGSSLEASDLMIKIINTDKVTLQELKTRAKKENKMLFTQEFEVKE